MKTCHFATFLLLIIGPIAHGQDTHTWSDSTGGTWGTFTKWTPVGLPAPQDTARFNLNLDYTVGLLQSRQTRLLQVLGGDVVIESTGIFAEDKTLELDDAFISNLGELVIRRGSNDQAMILTTSDDMTVRGAMTIADGAELDNQSVVVDSGVSNSTARLTIEGVGPLGARSRWDAAELIVGNLERGAIRVEDRGFVQIDGPATLGLSAGGSGEVVVNGQTPAGTASDFRVTGTLTIGDSGMGTFRLEDGANAATTDVIFGDSIGGYGTATLENNSVGNPAFWAAGNMNIKRGDLTVNSGGSLRTTSATIGTDAPSSITVSGAGNGSTLGRWNADGVTTISSSVDATLDIEQGGLVETEEVNIGQLAGGVGRINISSSNPDTESRWIQTGDLYLGGDSAGPGGVGHLNVNTNSYARVEGTITIFAGSSVVMGPTSQLVAPTIDNTQGGFFDFLRGTLNTLNYTGDLVNQEGTLAPYTFINLDGSGAGLTTINGNYSQQSGATLAIDINGELCGIGYDHVSVTGDATLGGDLQLTLLDEFVPQADDTFDVLAAATLLGMFDNVASGERLETTDGGGSFVVNYGAGSPFNVNQVILSDFLENVTFPGDYNGDELVGQGDLDLVLLNWGVDTNVTGVPTGWVNQLPNGLIGQNTLDVVLLNWGNQAEAITAARTAVPEPTTWALFAFAVMSVASTPRRCIASRLLP